MNKSKTAVTGSKQATVVAQKTSWKDRISSNDYEELKATFDLFDEDGGGTIDPIEV
jgi:Ca2+-binding EF-hand superfamily protein